ncbi:adenylate/guanylate cyclase domain-containing protein [Acaryochloris marina]|uniref:Adenylate cyclase, family 3, putative n=1 Tax=Acaryochloris marina (strain MBIC 11017) TaxID=329726 RepID=B0BYJ1_ACAM1|nr:adenylate/guanylate cyclase domain-containing protein [Acaryochloris marina]ABW25876.1 adenylate cyclase, family 3, putative [Acaryochloris marina MBIC11017]BDM80735.1 adenylate cyclase [Acaryochloris marina MBIC10699]
MSFEEILEQTIEILHRRGQVSYRAIKRQFDIDDQYLADLKYEIIDVLKIAVDRNQEILVAQTIEAHQLSLQKNYSHKLKTNINTPSEDGWSRETERRQLTVMFCDLVESSPLAERLDPEDLRDVFLAYQELCAEAIANAEGYIARYLGDGVLIYFGYPRAHEDDARRAVSSGLRILESLQKLNPKIMKKWGERLSVRIGIHTGLVVIGEMGVKDAPDPMAIVGATPNIAARLQSLAQPNTVVISAATQRLVQGFFECQKLEQQKLKGISDPIDIFQVLKESKAKSRFAVAEKSGLTPFVNRITETALLSERWQEAVTGHTHAVLLQGEAGMGKSRLVWEVKKNVAQAQDVWLTEIQGSPYYRNSAFYPITEFLKQTTFNFSQDDTSAEKLAKIEQFIGQCSLSQGEYAPLFASLLAVPFEEQYPPLNLTPERQKQKTIEAMTAVCLALAKQQPVLLVIEDLHWMDASTLDAITYFLEHIRDHRLLILLTCRPEFTSPWHTYPHLHALKLNSLGQKEIQVMVEETAQEKSLPQALVQQIVQKTDGIPLFVEELTKTVLEADVDESPVLNRFSDDNVSLAIPTTLHDSLIERLDRLSVVKEVAQLGSTLGREFDYELLEEVSQWNQATLRNGLNQLVESGLLYQEGSPPFAKYQFKHALIQDAAYQSLVKIRRQGYHQRIAYTLERRRDDQESIRPELLAYHFTEAGLLHAAIQYWLQAGQRDLGQAANSEAIAHLIRGLELLEGISEGTERDQLELQMQLGLAPAYMAIKGWASVEVEQTCLRAKILSSKTEDPQSQSKALWGLWTNYFLRGQMDEALEAAGEVWQKAQLADQSIMYEMACHAVGYTHFYRGEYVDARKVANEGLARFEFEAEQHLVFETQLSSAVCIHMFLAGSLWMLGYPDELPKQVEAAMELAQNLHHLPNKAYALGASLHQYQLTRHLPLVEDKAAELLDISRAEGFLLWIPVAMLFHGWSMAWQGRTQEGLQEMIEGLELFKNTGTSVIFPQVMGMLAEVYWLSERFEEAFQALDAGIQEATTRNEHHMEPELYRLKAEFLWQRFSQTQPKLQASDANIVEDCFKEAISLALKQNAIMLELRAVLSLGRFWHSQGNVDAARECTFEIYNRFTEGLGTPDLSQVRMFLDEIESSASLEG